MENRVIHSALGWLLSAAPSEYSGAGGQYVRKWETTTAIPAGWAMALAVICLLAAWWLVARETRLWPLHRRWTVFLLRGATYLLLAWMLLGWVVQPLRRQRADLPIVLDNSLSMNRVDGDRQEDDFQRIWKRSGGEDLGEPSRWNLARSVFLNLSPNQRANLNERYRTRIISLDGQHWEGEQDEAAWRRHWESLDATFPESPLGERLQHLAGQQRGRDTAAIVLLTDGADTGDLTLARASHQLAKSEVPLWIVLLGSSSAERDLEIQQVTGPSDVWLGDVFSIDVSVAWQGFANSSLNLVVSETAGGQVLARRTLDVSTAGQQAQQDVDRGQLRTTILLEAQHSGPQQLAVEVEAVEGETRQDNNRQFLDVRVHDETTRVLLVSSAPSYEFRYLHNLLRRLTTDESGSQATFDVTAVLQEADQPTSTGDVSEPMPSEDLPRVSFPATRQELAEYDVFVLGDADPTRIPAPILEDLRTLVTEQGKGLLLLAGPQYMPQAFRNTAIADAFPFQWSGGAGEARIGDQSGWQWQLTPLGQAHAHLRLAPAGATGPSDWKQLPGFYWLWSGGRTQPGSMVLVEAVDADQNRTPVITTRYWGRGRVVWHASDELYRWRSGADDSYYARYWLQTLHYLHAVAGGDSQDARLWTSRTSYAEHQPVVLTAQLSGQTLDHHGLAVHLEGSDGGHRRVSLQPVDGWPGRMEGEIVDLPPGTYHATLATGQPSSSPAACTFQVLASDRESTAVSPPLQELESLARSTGGQCLPYEQAAELWGNLPPGRSVISAALPPRGLWNAWWMALALVGLLGGEWLLRWKWGYW